MGEYIKFVWRRPLKRAIKSITKGDEDIWSPFGISKQETRDIIMFMVQMIENPLMEKIFMGEWGEFGEPKNFMRQKE